MAELNLYQRAVSYLYSKAGIVKQRPPRHIAGDIVDQTLIDFSQFDEEELIKLIRYISWIYADIALLSRVVWAADFRMKEPGKSRKMVDVVDHPFLDVFNDPNPWMTKNYLMEYMMGWLMTSRRGAFWYLAPNVDDPNELLEIWPLNSNQVQVEKSGDFVRSFIYHPRGSDAKPFRINPDNVVWFRLGNQYNYWESMPPILAALAPGKIEAGIQKSQDKLYNDNRGLPLTLVSLDPDLSEPDFEVARNQIKQDWQDEGSTIAVTRAGQIDVKSLGFTQAELQTLLAQNLTRNQIDAIFFGYSIRADQLTSGEGLKEMDKILKEQVFWPTLILIQDHIQNQIIKRFYPGDAKARYQDPRTYDRALNIQEKTIDSRWNTPNEMRERDGDPPMEDPKGLEGLGDLPIPLASNASFVAQYFGIEGVSKRTPAAPADVGNLSDFQDPESLTNQLARGNDQAIGNEITVKSAVNEGIKTELKRYRTVAKRNLTRHDNPLYRQFETDVIPKEIFLSVTKGLEKVATEEELMELFEPWLI